MDDKTLREFIQRMQADGEAETPVTAEETREAPEQNAKSSADERAAGTVNEADEPNDFKLLALAGSTAVLDLHTGKAVLIFTDYSANDTLLGLNVRHVFGNYGEDLGCGENFRLNLYERIDGGTVSPKTYTDGLGNRYAFSDDENGKPTVIGMEFSNSPSSAVQKIKAAGAFKGISEPVCWLKNESVTKGFDGDGRLVMVSDGFGNYTRVLYGSDGLISGVEHKNGSKATFVYSLKKLARIDYAANKKRVKYTYDEEGKLIKISYCDAYSTYESVYKTVDISYTQIYDNGETRTAVSKTESSDKLLSEIEYEGDIKNDTRLTGVRNYSTVKSIPNGAADKKLTDITVADYNDDIKTVTLTDYYGDSKVYKFSDEGELTEYYEIVNGLVARAEKNSYAPYQSNVNLSAGRESLNKYTLSEFSFGEGVKTETLLNGDNKPVKITSDKIPTGDGTYKTTETVYEYDGNKKCVKSESTEKYFNSSNLCVFADYTTVNAFYDEDTGAAKKSVTHFAHDENGERVDEYAEVTEYFYDENGNVITSKRYVLNAEHSASEACACGGTADGFYDEKTYDAYNRVISVKDQTGLNSTYLIPRAGTNLIAEVFRPGFKDLNDAYATFTFDSEGRTIKTTSTVNDAANSNYSYYQDGELTELSSNAKNTVKYYYDEKRRPIEVLINDALYERFTYEDKVLKNGVYVDRVTVNNSNNEQFKIETVKSKNEEYVYYNGAAYYGRKFSAFGELEAVQDLLGGAVYNISYNSAGAVNEYKFYKTDNDYKEVFEYDAKGRVTKITHTGSVERTDTFNYSEVTEDGYSEKVITGGITSRTDYDLYGRYTGVTVLSGRKTVNCEEITYLKENDRLTDMPESVKYLDGMELSYSYDNRGNISSISRDGVIEAKYEYDKLDRLTREDNSLFEKSYLYSYDNNGNITCKEVRPYAEEDGTVINYTYDKDRLTSYNGEACVYDIMGNPTTYRGKSATWKYGRRLISFDGNTFKYDGQGHRIEKNGITFTYDSQNRLIKQSNGLEFFYDNTGLLGLKYNSKTYIYQKDIQGNIIAVLDSNGNVVVEYFYDAWGNHEVSGSLTIGNLNPFRYRSYYYDTETNLYFLQTRYYDPEVGRFLNMDSPDYADPETINGLNLYSYCNNNPVMNIDPTGTNWWNDICNGIAGFFNTLGKGLNQFANNIRNLFSFGNNGLIYDEGFGFDISINADNSFNQSITDTVNEIVDELIDGATEVIGEVTTITSYVTDNIDKFMRPGAAFLWDDVFGYLSQNQAVNNILTYGGLFLLGFEYKFPQINILFPNINVLNKALTIIGGIILLRSKWRK